MFRSTLAAIRRTGILQGVPVFFSLRAGMILSFALAGCDRITPTPSAPVNYSAPSPGREELYVAGPYRLSMSAFEGLRREFPGLTPTDAAQFALATQWFSEVEKINLKDAARCVRALFSPPLSPKILMQTETRMKSQFGIQTIEVLRKRWGDALSRSVIEWNFPLARDYGIDPPSVGRNSR